ncbi:MAG: hypothetical protein GY835_16545, partial [bacterium]|nr:hypothetical protein [bacterium]
YQDPDDPFNLTNYYTYLSNLATWEGRFDESISFRKARLVEAEKTGDSLQVYSALNGLAEYFRHFGQIDSMLVYNERAFQWANMFNKLSYPMMLAATDTAFAAEVRPVFDEVINDMRAKLPRDFWHLADAMEQMFEGLAAADTAKVIEAMEYIQANEGTGGGTENGVTLGLFLIAADRPAEAVEVLSIYTSGKR